MSDAQEPAKQPSGDRWQQLQARLLAQGEILGRQGSLASRRAGRQRVWALRFHELMPDGRRVQRSIYVGADEALVARTQHLLDQLRLLGRWMDTAADLLPLVASLRRCVARQSKVCSADAM